MKLLTWMHRKFRQGDTETIREFPMGQPLLEDPHLYQKQAHANGTWRHVHRDGQARSSSANFETTKLTDFEEKASAEFSEFFEGFLAIGTLGAETGIREPETPTFSMSFEKLAEGETEVTENELRLINDELERVLATEAKDDGWTDSSSRTSHVSNGRTSHVSNGRISHASTITLSGKPLEISESTGNGNSNCPLQEYLLGSAVELPETVVAPKKENRTSLGELFEKHKAEDVSEPKYKRGEKRVDKESEKTAMNLMKKIMKKKMASAASKNSSGATRGTTESKAAETKLFKILHKFQRKVHPEDLIASSAKAEKADRNGYKEMIPCKACYYKEKHTFPDGMSSVSKRSCCIGHMRLSKSLSSSSQFSEDDSDSNGSRECWIKTDADYLVLEL
ncbi:protein LAZY 1 [Silene latifolia]|uniref:protein LAZY 1 n=1 Tax=Silene latifolia TaxID=37657 RepID=UPI003D781C8A